jgi:hypothetical protein
MKLSAVENFEVGDWVIMKEKIVEKLKVGCNKRTIEYIDSLIYPTRIIEIKYRDEHKLPTTYKMASNEWMKVDIESYRLATNKEIKQYQLKSAFIES